MMNPVRRKWRRLLAALPIGVLLCALLPGTALAATTVSGNNPAIPVGRVIHDDLYIGGQNVDMNGTVTGNLIAAGGNIDVNGRVDGSIVAVGGNITVNGTVGGSIITAGGNLDVANSIGKDVTMFGGNLHLLPGSTVGRDVLAAAGTVTIEGHVARNLKALGTLQLRSGAVIGGNLTYRGAHRPVISVGTAVHGRIIHETGGVFSWSGANLPWNQGPSFLGWLRTLVGLLALGLIFVWLAPRYAARTARNLQTRWLAALGWGLVALIVTPVLAVLVFVIGLFIGGWWLGLILLGLYAVALALAGMVAGMTVVTIAAREAEQPMPVWVAMIVGVALVTLLALVPYLGWLALMIGVIWGLGGLAMTLFERATAASAQLSGEPIADRKSKMPVPPLTTPVA